MLNSIKKMLGLASEYKVFDEEIISAINSATFSLYQIGFTQEPFVLTNDTQTWDSFLLDKAKQDVVKSFIYLKVRLQFDPPQSSFAIEAIERQINELEWRIMVNNDQKLVP